MRKNVMVLDPHSDDWINCCGAIQHHKRRGYNIVILALSGCEESLPHGYSIEDYHKEWKESISKMDISVNDVHMGKQWFSNLFTVRMFNTFRQNILDLFIKYRKIYAPEIVYCPSTYDSHQDHAVVSNEAIRAFSKSSTIYGYDMPWNTLNSHIHHYVELAEPDMEIKVSAAQCYKSQTCKPNNSLSPEFIRALAMVRGNRIQTMYAEGFETIVSRE